MKLDATVVVIVGPSGSGKTFFESKFLRSFWGWKKLVSFTTRPQRPNEIDGVDYHFITKDEVKDLNVLQQMSIYGNTYGTSVEHLHEHCVNILVTGVDGPEQFAKVVGAKNVIPVFIDSKWYTRVIRLVKRDGFKEGIKRFMLDVGRFKGLDMDNFTILKN